MDHPGPNFIARGPLGLLALNIELRWSEILSEALTIFEIHSKRKNYPDFWSRAAEEQQEKLRVQVVGYQSTKIKSSPDSLKVFFWAANDRNVRALQKSLLESSSNAILSLMSKWPDL